MKKLSWLKVGQHQFQKNVTHRLTLVLVDGRDNECVFSCLIGVFLLAVTSSIASSTKLLAQSIPCFVSDCRGHVSTPKSRGYRKSNRELPFPAFGASGMPFVKRISTYLTILGFFFFHDNRRVVMDRGRVIDTGCVNISMGGGGFINSSGNICTCSCAYDRFACL